MGQSLGAAYVAIKGDLSQLDKDFDKAKKSTESTASSIQDKLGSAFKWVGLAAAAAATGAVYEIQKLARESVSLANIQEAAETKLAAVIKSTGGAAGLTAQQMFDMAASFQKVTTVGDEVIINGQAVLATFKNIKGEGFERTTMAALDMAQVMGTDLQSAIVMIGKAMNDPIANLSAMSRAGVQFTVEQKAMVKQLWESGDMMGAQAIILKELESQFGGAAAAARNTFGGSVKAAENALGDLKEQIGFAITKNEVFIGLVKDIEQAFIDAQPKVKEMVDLFAGWVKENEALIKQNVKSTLEGMGSALIKIAESMATIAKYANLRSISETYLEAQVLARQGLIDMDKFREATFLERQAMVDLAVQHKGTYGIVTKSIKDATGYQEIYNYSVKDSAKITTETLEGSVMAWHRTTVKISDEVKQMFKQMELEGELYYEKGSEITLKTIAEAASAMDKIEDINEESANARLQLYDRLSSGMTVRDTQYFYNKKILLDSEKSAYIKLYGDLPIIIEAFNDKFKRLEQEKLLAVGSFTDGVRVAYQQMIDEQVSWAERGKDIFDTFVSSANAAFSDTLFSTLKGDLDNFESIWKGFLDSMLKAFTDMIAEMVVKALASGLLDIIGGILGGGGGGLLDWWPFESGAWMIKQDTPAMLHAGEMVVPADVATMWRNAAQVATYDLNYGTNTPPWFSDSGEAGSREIPGGTRSFPSRVDLRDTFGGAFGLGSFLSGGPIGFLGGGLARTAGAAVMDDTGIRGKFGQVGGILGQLLGSVLAPNPLLGLMGGIIGNPLGTLAGDAIGDMLDLRGTEPLRDYLENEFGYFGGRRGFASGFYDKAGTMADPFGGKSQLGNLEAVYGGFIAKNKESFEALGIDVTTELAEVARGIAEKAGWSDAEIEAGLRDMSSTIGEDLDAFGSHVETATKDFGIKGVEAIDTVSLGFGGFTLGVKDSFDAMAIDVTDMVGYVGDVVDTAIGRAEAAAASANEAASNAAAANDSGFGPGTGEFGEVDRGGGGGYGDGPGGTGGGGGFGGSDMGDAPGSDMGTYQFGGRVPKTGAAWLHAGEEVITRENVERLERIFDGGSGRPVQGNINIYFNDPLLKKLIRVEADGLDVQRINHPVGNRRLHQ